MTKTQGSTY